MTRDTPKVRLDGTVLRCTRNRTYSRCMRRCCYLNAREGKRDQLKRVVHWRREGDVAYKLLAHIPFFHTTDAFAVYIRLRVYSKVMHRVLWSTTLFSCTLPLSFFDTFLTQRPPASLLPSLLPTRAILLFPWLYADSRLESLVDERVAWSQWNTERQSTIQRGIRLNENVLVRW